MGLVESLLTAITRADGDALVMHVGEKPYVVASMGVIELSTHALTLQALAGMVAQLLPAELQRALSEFGAVEHELPPRAAVSGDRFTVVVARGAGDVWVEIQRHRRPSAASAAAQDAHQVESRERAAEESVERVRVASPPRTPDSVLPPPTEHQHTEVPAHMVDAHAPHAERMTDGAPAEDAWFHREGATLQAPFPTSEFGTETAAPVETTEAQEGKPESAEHLEGREVMSGGEGRAFGRASTTEHVPDAPTTSLDVPAATDHMLSAARTLSTEAPPSVTAREVPGSSEVGRLLDLTSARGGTALYLTTNAPPFLRLEDEVRPLEGELVMSAAALEAAILEFLPGATAEMFRQGQPTEWMTAVAGVGRVRCSTFHDHRGPGATFHLISLRPQTAESLGLTAEMQALANEAEGLVLIASPAGHGKSTLLGALVDLVNRRRSGYVITLEPQVRVVHEHRAALVSQREISGTAEQALAIARAALRERPDVLVIEDVSSTGMADVALDAAGAGLLVMVSMTAPSSTAAIEQLLELYPPEGRAAVRARLAELVRGVVAQVLLRPAGGRRVPARELLLPTAAVVHVLADGQLHDLPAAIDRGRPHGLLTLTESLVRHVRSGGVDVREAYRKAADRVALVAALKRENVDTSFIERTP